MAFQRVCAAMMARSRFSSSVSPFFRVRRMESERQETVVVVVVVTVVGAVVAGVVVVTVVAASVLAVVVALMMVIVTVVSSLPDHQGLQVGQIWDTFPGS